MKAFKSIFWLPLNAFCLIFFLISGTEITSRFKMPLLRVELVWNFLVLSILQLVPNFHNKRFERTQAYQQTYNRPRPLKRCQIVTQSILSWTRFQAEQERRSATMMLTSELKSRHFWASALIELIATFFFIFLTTGTTITWNPMQPPSTELISLCFGLSIATLAMCSLHLSGGHINPAVSIAMMAVRKVSVIRGITYVIFQIVGGENTKSNS